VASFSWYDQDNLMVVAGNSPGGAQIEELSVNGGVVGPSSTTPIRFPAPAGRYPVAIAADSTDNVLVVTLNDNELWVATSSEDPSWVQLGPEGKGQGAAYGGPETG
jgi:hypothetical protein